MIRIAMTRQDAGHPDKKQHHPGRVSCEVGGRRFEAQGPAPVYRLSTLLWLHGHEGERFKVWDDVSPTGRPGGLAITGRVRNWARPVNGKPTFGRDAPWGAGFSPHEREVVARAAGRVIDPAGTDSPAAGNARTARSLLPGARHPREQDGASAGVVGAQAPAGAT